MLDDGEEKVSPRNPREGQEGVGSGIYKLFLTMALYYGLGTEVRRNAAKEIQQTIRGRVEDRGWAYLAYFS